MSTSPVVPPFAPRRPQRPPPLWAGAIIGIAVAAPVTVLLQVVLFFVLMAHTGTPRDRTLQWVGFSLSPLLAMALLALLAHLFKRHSLAAGFWIGGALGTLAAGLCWGTMLLPPS